MDLSFSGAGFMGCYYFGVVDCWNKYIPRDRVNRCAGASAGSLISAYYLMDLPLSSCLKAIIELTEDVRRRPLGVFDRSNQIVDILPRILDSLFPEDAHKRVSGRLFVGMTRLKDMKKVVVSEFETRQDLIDALNCSCFIPVWSGNHVPTHKGVKHIDGGFSDNLPVFDEHTIRICCFSGASDISPYDRVKAELFSGTFLNTPLYLNFANCRRARKALFPPPASVILDLLERGFHDAKDFILSNDLIQCHSCFSKTDFKDQPIYHKVSPTLTPCASPALSRVPSQRAPAAPLLAPPGAGGQRVSFRSQLHHKLRDFSSSAEELDDCRQQQVAATGTAAAEADANNNPTIVVVVDDHDERQTRGSLHSEPATPTSSSSSGNSSLSSESAERETPAPVPEMGGKRRAEAPAAGLGRRNTTQLNANQLLVDRFAFAPNPLPSCPPSPNLNRHCTECIQMRQEARADLVAEEIKQEAEKYKNPIRESRFKNKLASPFRWIRQLGKKSSYSFEAP